MGLKEVLESQPEDLLIANKDLRNNAYHELKQKLDFVAPNYSPLDAIHVDGLKAEQVWVQSQMVLESVLDKMTEKLQNLLPAQPDNQPEGSNSSFDSNSDSLGSGSELDDDSEGRLDDLHDDFEEEDLDEGVEEGIEDAEEDIEDEEIDEEEEDADANGDVGAGVNTANEDKDNFDLAEFQQHVLQLDQIENESNEEDEEIDYFNEIQDSSDDADMKYEDFFGKRQNNSKPKLQSQTNSTNLKDEDEVMEIMSNTRKDLFDSEEDEDELEGPELSKFEQQQQEIAAQINQLEDENVGQKEWGMRGEIKAKERPEESLVDADIEFERNAKPAPVITDEVTLDIEQLIKERIRKMQFDDIPKRSETLDIHTKRELPELSQNKSQKSLAELYEEDHQRQENPDYYTQLDKEALTESHQEAIALFKQVTAQLDALCNWQYTPRAPAESITIKTNQPTIRMEDQQPNTMAMNDTRAPQEVYKAEKSAPMADSEMSSSLKRRKRKAKKSAKQETGGKKEEMFNTLKKGNVTLVDKRGEKRNLQGNKSEQQQKTASSVKL